MKARACADGCSQHPYILKEEYISPTVSTYEMFVTLTVDAHEEICVATADIVGTYLNDEMNRVTILKLEGSMVNLMVQVNPEKYEEYISYENGKHVLYLRLLKALYGYIISSLL